MTRPKTDGQAEKLNALAFHEAGHAVAAHVLEIRFSATTIVPNERYLGSLLVDPAHWKCWIQPGGMDGLTREQAERQILVFLAGLPAERLAKPEAKASGSRQDELEARSLVEEILGIPAAYTNRATDRAWKQARIAYLDYMRLCAEQIVQYHRRAIGVLAKVLLEEREVEAGRVGEIIASVTPRPVRAPAILRMGTVDYSPQAVIQGSGDAKGVTIRHRTTGEVLHRHETEPFVNIDVRGLDLQGASLAGIAFRGRAFMEGVTLREADLRGTTLHYAQLQEATLAGADLQGASLYAANLTRANLSRAVLDGTDLSYAKLEGAVLVAAMLHGASLWGANLSGANLSRANLTGAILCQAKLESTCLCGATLIGTDLRGANLLRADPGSEWERTGTLSGCSVTGAVYDEATQWPEGFDPKQHGAVLRDGPGK